MKKGLMAAALAVVVCAHFSQSFAAEPDILVEEDFIVRPTIHQYGYGEAPTGRPVFEFGAIKMSADGMGRCGGVTLVPYPGYNVQVLSQRFVKKFWGSTPQPGKILSNSWVDVPQGGLRVKYDRGGGEQDHYKIFCRLATGELNDCSHVLTIQDVSKGLCFAVDATYAPLNMSIKAK